MFCIVFCVIYCYANIKLNVTINCCDFLGERLPTKSKRPRGFNSYPIHILKSPFWEYIVYCFTRNYNSM